ncbi:MAG: radical SAM protein [Candidatus Aminicenantes bacterium]|jgi:radical SAM superfamily enzyme YgiQ (UPF0313 family)
MTNHGGIKKTKPGNSFDEKILLITLPFWSTLIPSQGPASLKSFLQKYGYKVKAVDATSEKIFLELYNQYFEILKAVVPRNHQGNFYNIGHDVLRNHMMAYTNYTDPEEYHRLVSTLVEKTYYYTIDGTVISKLNSVLMELFSRIEKFVLDLLEKETPSLLGLSTNSGNLASTRFAFELTRKEYPQIRTLMGGSVFLNHLAIGNPDLELFLEKTKSYIDNIIIGKGEILFLKYLEGRLPRSRRIFTQADLNEDEKNSYTFDIPDLTDYDLQKYLYLAATGSVGCPFRCSFCNIRTWFGKFFKKDPIQTVKEMRELQKRHNHRLFFMTDSLLNFVITDISKEIIKRELTIYMDGYFAVDKEAEDIENTLLWRRGGFYRARLGLESGSQRVLDLMGKKISPEQIRTAVSNLAHAGIKTTTYWVIGHPEETEQDFQQTLDLVEELKNDIWQAECNPFTYFYLGQGNSEKWKNKRMLLYPQETRGMLDSQTWVLDCQPSRQETYKRMNRFVEHCNKLGIPNPYLLDEIYKADERWRKLHKNAVPSILEIVNHSVDFSERKKVKKFLPLQTKYDEEEDFDF